MARRGHFMAPEYDFGGRPRCEQSPASAFPNQMNHTRDQENDRNHKPRIPNHAKRLMWDEQGLVSEACGEQGQHDRQRCLETDGFFLLEHNRADPPNKRKRDYC